MQVIGHRGAAGLVAENTLAGFRRAIELGVDAAECDVHLSRDGQLVVIHDATVDRTTNGTGAVSALELDQIRQLDAGDGARVPTLEEVLDTVHGHCELVCEMKADGVEAGCVELVSAKGMLPAVTFISFHMEHLRNVLRFEPAARTGWLSVCPSPDQIGEAAADGFDLIAMSNRLVTPETIDAVRGAGLGVTVWTPNDPDEMRTLLAMEVDGITTDRPDLLLKELGRLAEGD